MREGKRFPLNTYMISNDLFLRRVRSAAVYLRGCLEGYLYLMVFAPVNIIEFNFNLLTYFFSIIIFSNQELPQTKKKLRQFTIELRPQLTGNIFLSMVFIRR